MENRRKFEIVVGRYTGNRKIIEVDGYPVKVKGLEEFNFFVHKTHNMATKWNMSEVSTGMSIGVVCDTRKGAISSGSQHLHQIDAREMIKRASKLDDLKKELVKVVKERISGNASTYNNIWDSISVEEIKE